jgi:hypothetical protein
MNIRRARLRSLVDEPSRAIVDGFSLVFNLFLEVGRKVETLSRENGNNNARALSQGDAQIAFDNAIIALHDLVGSIEQSPEHTTHLENPALAASCLKLSVSLMNNLQEIQRGEKT